MNVRLNLSPIGHAGIGDGHEDYIQCSYQLPFMVGK
jgi:hypothetical protein